MDSLDYLLKLIVTFLLGEMGALIALKLRFPSAYLLGPILMVSTYQVFINDLVDKPGWLRLIIQIAAGVVIGTSFAKVSIETFKRLMRPALAVALIMVIGGLTVATILNKITGIEIITSILSTTPGGQGEMILLAEGAGAYTEKVLILQLLRNQMVLLIMLPLSKTILNLKRSKLVKEKNRYG
ncbi:MAG: hypothetical protein VR72_00630 [Clostridiaceae bacterium BRH_c20a]|nr:MAG: hypothetical protein VR72_00630 [Clostridiaceae bacterium BRH_c20a]